MRIGILGPAGTFSEMAALKWVGLKKINVEMGMGMEVEMRYYDTILDVSESILSKEVDYGIVPIKICLLALNNFDRVKKIVSHPHALAQCKRFLRARCKDKEVKPVDSTAVAAKQASQSEEILSLIHI